MPICSNPGLARLKLLGKVGSLFPKACLGFKLGLLLSCPPSMLRV